MLHEIPFRSMTHCPADEQTRGQSHHKVRLRLWEGAKFHLALACDCGRMTGNPEVMPRMDSQRRGPEVGFGEIAIDFLQARFWTARRREQEVIQHSEVPL